jgi:hypothetical protein
MEAILFGFLITLLGFSNFFAKDFWWGIQEFTNQTRGLVSERTGMWEIGMNFSGFITVLVGFAFMYFGIQDYQLRSQPVIPSICNEINSMSGTNKVQNAIQIACAAAQRKDYRAAVTNFKEALNIRNRINNSPKNLNASPFDSGDYDLRYAIGQMERQLKK